MIFTLEALQADHGDCLILHYGDNQSPKMIVIDGGPSQVYRDFLKPRLLEIKARLSPDDPLPLSMVMVSHMDEDHVLGILKMSAELVQADEDSSQPNFNIENLWVNTFDDIVGNLQIPHISGLAASATVANLIASVPALANRDQHITAVLASTGQGRDLRNNAEKLVISVNNPFTALNNGAALVRGDVGGSSVNWGSGLTIRVLHPNEDRLLRMQKKWDADLREAREKGDDSIMIASLTDPDKSPFNLASIVCLVEFAGKRILLTGDAREDDVLDGLKKAGLLDADDHIHVDILKLPHHGSSRNVSEDLFRQVTADHYIISANGRDHNPDQITLDKFLSTTVGRDNFTIHFTNHDGRNNLQTMLDGFEAEAGNTGRTFGINFRTAGQFSIRLNLLDAIDY